MVRRRLRRAGERVAGELVRVPQRPLAAVHGGAKGEGTVFQITPTGVVSMIYSFDGTHGAGPYSGLFLGTDGDFYGVTDAGGINNKGTIYKITPTGTLTTFYSF